MKYEVIMRLTLETENQIGSYGLERDTTEIEQAVIHAAPTSRVTSEVITITEIEENVKEPFMSLERVEIKCNHCDNIVLAVIRKQIFKNGSGHHLRADCPHCGHFIKFVSQT